VVSDIRAALAALNTQIAALGAPVPPAAGPAPTPADLRRPYIGAGHAPASAPASQRPSVPHNTPTVPAGSPGVGVRIAGQPAITPEPVMVPAATGGNPLSALQQPHAAVAVNHLDLGRQASPTMSPQLGVRAPAGMPIQSPAGIAPSGYRPGGAR
jgi:hypothetical protein